MRRAGNGGGPPDAAAIRAARANIRYHLRYIGYLTRGGTGLPASELSFADLAAAAELSCVDYLGEVPWEEDAMAKDWYTRMKSRPALPPAARRPGPRQPAGAHYADLDF